MNSMAMLATQLNHMVTDDGPTKLTNFCVVRVDRYVTNAIRGEKSVTVNLETIGCHVAGVNFSSLPVFAGDCSSSSS